GSTEDGARKITRRVEPHGGRSPRHPPPLWASLAEFLRTHRAPAATPPVHPNDTRRPPAAAEAGDAVREPVVCRGPGPPRGRPAPGGVRQERGDGARVGQDTAGEADGIAQDRPHAGYAGDVLAEDEPFGLVPDEGLEPEDEGRVPRVGGVEPHLRKRDPLLLKRVTDTGDVSAGRFDEGVRVSQGVMTAGHWIIPLSFVS